MIDPQSYEAVLRPDHGDADVDVKLLPDTGEAAVEAVQLFDPPIAVVPTDGEIEPPIVRHDPFAHMRGAPWMNRKLSPSGRGETEASEAGAEVPGVLLPPVQAASRARAATAPGTAERRRAVGMGPDATGRARGCRLIGVSSALCRPR